MDLERTLDAADRALLADIVRLARSRRDGYARLTTAGAVTHVRTLRSAGLIETLQPVDGRGVLARVTGKGLSVLAAGERVR